MALNSGSVIIPGKGTVFVGDPNADPLDKATLDPATTATYEDWDCLGHTSRDNAVSLSKDGGDATNLGSWWDSALVTNRDAVSWSITVNSLQMDALTFGLAFPAGAVSMGGYAIDSDPGSVEKALAVLMINGAKRMLLHFPRVSLSIGDAPSISTDSFFEIQLLGSVLSATEAAEGITVGRVMKIFPPVALS